jgi:hypothetical protein
MSKSLLGYDLANIILLCSLTLERVNSKVQLFIKSTYFDDYYYFFLKDFLKSQVKILGVT